MMTTRRLMGWCAALLLGSALWLALDPAAGDSVASDGAAAGTELLLHHAKLGAMLHAHSWESLAAMMGR